MTIGGALLCSSCPIDGRENHRSPISGTSLGKEDQVFVRRNQALLIALSDIERAAADPDPWHECLEQLVGLVGASVGWRVVRFKA